MSTKAKLVDKPTFFEVILPEPSILIYCIEINLAGPTVRDYMSWEG